MHWNSGPRVDIAAAALRSEFGLPVAIDVVSDQCGGSIRLSLIDADPESASNIAFKASEMVGRILGGQYFEVCVFDKSQDTEEVRALREAATL